MDSPAAFRVASNNIHSQVFDDEVVVMDMATGLYYSLRGSAIEIWVASAAGATREAMIAALGARYAAPASDIAAAVDAGIETLTRHGLIAAAPGDDLPPAPSPATTVAAQRVPLGAPAIECFTDMQELLLLDPIHEVGDAGWPHAVAPAPGQG